MKVFHRDQKVKELRIDPLESFGELKVSWKDENGVRHCAWLKVTTYRQTAFFKDDGEIKQ